MLMWRKKQTLTLIAISILLFFISVSLLHALVPHEHPHESFVSEFGLPVHNVAGEKYFLLLMLASLLVVIPLIDTAKDFFLAWRLEGQSLKQNAAPPPIYVHIFAQGILHSKAY